MKNTFLFLILIFSFTVLAQDKKINIIHADFTDIDEENHPGATIGLGNVVIEVDGATLTCKKVFFYEKDNYLQALGDVLLNQADTITQSSDYIEYDGKTKQSLSWGNVMLKNQTMTLKTDTLHFDRVSQQLFYKHHATIVDSTNTLKSKKGNYYLNLHKFIADTDVIITNPDYVLKSKHLDYYTNSGKAYLHGKTTIKGEESFIFAEKGYYDTKADISHFNKNAYILYKDRRIDADSLYYNRRNGFASATKNVVMTDTINKMVLKGRYAEFYQHKDSAFVVGKKSVAISETEKGKFYIHGDTLLFTGKPEKRIIRAYHHVKFFKDNMSGKCDSLYSNKEIGLLKLFRKPVLWTTDGQITGKYIHIRSNSKTEKLDSLKVLGDAFLIQKDSIKGFNQIKGRDMFAKFNENELQTVDFIGNGETLIYLRDESPKKELYGIQKTICNKIHVEFENKEAIILEFYQQESETFPPSKLPENTRELKDFLWREEERPKNADDIYEKTYQAIETTKKRLKNRN